MQQLLDAFIRHLIAEKNLSALTLRNYRTDLGHFFTWLDSEGIGVNGADRLTVRRYLADLKQNGMATASLTRKTSTIRTFYRFLIREGHLDSSPLVGLVSPKREKRLPTVLKREDLAEIIGSANETTSVGLRNRAILELMYAAGVRLSEVVSLDLKHLDLDERTLLVRGKGNKERIVLVGAPAEKALRRYLARGRPQLVARAQSALFVNRNGGRLSGRSIQNIVRRQALAAGLDQRVWPHLLRHSFATHMLDGGADLRVVQELLGHESAQTTQIYTHVTQERQREAYVQAFYNQSHGRSRRRPRDQAS
jgi:tyrosine recombinase XerC